MEATRVLSDDFIDEAQVRFARSTTKELARYIEAATIDAMVWRFKRSTTKSTTWPVDPHAPVVPPKRATR